MNKISYSFCKIIGKDGVLVMNLSILDELELFSKELQQYMSPYALEQLA